VSGPTTHQEARGDSLSCRVGIKDGDGADSLSPTSRDNQPLGRPGADFRGGGAYPSARRLTVRSDCKTRPSRPSQQAPHHRHRTVTVRGLNSDRHEHAQPRKQKHQPRRRLTIVARVNERNNTPPDPPRPNQVALRPKGLQDTDSPRLNAPAWDSTHRQLELNRSPHGLGSVSATRTSQGFRPEKPYY
jgi:hypothetical protein